MATVMVVTGGGAVLSEQHLSEFSINEILTTRGEEEKDYVRDDKTDVNGISIVRWPAQQQVIVQLFDHNGETTLYIGDERAWIAPDPACPALLKAA